MAKREFKDLAEEELYKELELMRINPEDATIGEMISDICSLITAPAEGAGEPPSIVDMTEANYWDDRLSLGKSYIPQNIYFESDSSDDDINNPTSPMFVDE